MIKTLLVEDHDIVREGLKRLLSDIEDIIISDEAENGKTAIEKILAGSFDLILLDLSLSDMSGYQVLEQIRNLGSTIPVLVLSRYPEDQYATRAIKLGASGYISKKCNKAELTSAMRAVAKGDIYASPGVVKRLVRGLQGTPKAMPHEFLTEREFEVMGLLAKGNTGPDIASKLSLSKSTIHSHRKNIFKKMGLANISDLIRYVADNDILQ